MLDIACGSGGWVLELAKRNPTTIHATGLDISHPMVQFARAYAYHEGINNVTFDLIDATHYPLPYKDGSFDLVNVRFIYAFMTREEWPLLMRECYRILKSPGYLRMTTDDGHLLTNSRAMSDYHRLGSLALYRRGNAFTPYNIGLISRLKPLSTQAGFVQVSQTHYLSDISYGTTWYQIAYEDYKSLFRRMLHLLDRYNVLEQALSEDPDLPYRSLDDLYDLCLEQMQGSDFTATWHNFSLFAKRP